MGMKRILVMMAAVVLVGCGKKEDELQKLANQAFEEAKIKANKGDAAAQCWVGSVYRHSENHNEAIKWYRKAADQGNASGQFILGLMYANGEGVPEKNIEKAIKWYRLAADQGNKAAEENLEVLLNENPELRENNPPRESP